MSFVGPTILADVHELSGFESSSLALNDWLKKRARRNHQLNFSRVFVVCLESAPTVIAYYCLSAASIQRDLLPKSLRRNAPDPIPAVVLGRLAVDLRYEGQGLGRDLVKHAVRMTEIASESVGVRVLLVKAKDDKALSFYREVCGFVELPDSPLTLFDPVIPKQNG